MDDHTLQVTIEAPLPYFPKMLTHASVFPVNQKVIEANGDKWTEAGTLVGNGAYVLKEHILGEKVVMEPNPMYWDNEHTVLQKVTALTINDQDAALTRYLAGELDRVDIPAGRYPQMKAEYPDQAISVPQSCSYIYMFNLDEAKGPAALKDVRVRKALSYAIDRDIIVNNILQGGQAPSYNWTHAATEGFSLPEIDYANWTPGRAHREGEGTSGRGRLWPGQAAEPDAQLQHLGIAQEDRDRRAAVLEGRRRQPHAQQHGVEGPHRQDAEPGLRGRPLCLVRRLQRGLDLSRPLHLLFRATTTASSSAEEYDQLMKESKTAADPNPMYTAAEQILADEMPMAPIYQYTKVEMIKPDIRAPSLHNLMQNWYLKDMYRVAN